MKLFKTTEYRVTLLLIFALLVQIIAPIAENHVYANEVEEIYNVEQSQDITIEDDTGEEDQEETEPSEGQEQVDETSDDDKEEEVPEDGEEDEGESNGENPSEEEPNEEGETDLEDDENPDDSQVDIPEEEEQTEEPTEEEIEETEEDIEEIPEEIEEEFIGPKLEGEIIPFVEEDTEFKFLTDVKITDEDGNPFKGPIAKDSKMRIQYNYEIEDEFEVNTSEEYKLTIPEEIKIIKEMEILLKNGDGDLIATVYIDTNNNVTIKFDENVNAKGIYDRNGHFWVYSEFDAEKIGEGGETEIVFDLGGDSTQKIKVEFEKEEEKVDVNLIKSGKYDDNKNEITWNIEVKPETTPSGGSIENLVISDEIQEGQTYVEGSANISPKDAKGSFNFGDGKLTYTFSGSIEDGKVYNITFKTKPDLSAFDSEGKTIYFKNKAEATFGEDEKSVSNEASVKTTVDFIRKEGKYNYETKQIDWTVEINNNNLEINDAKIVDTIPKGLELVEDSVKLSPELVGATHTFEGSAEAEDGTKLIYTLGNIDKRYILTYSTKVVDEDAYKSNNPKIYTNKVELGGTGVPDNAKAEEGVGVPTHVIEKWSDAYNGYNPSTREITWFIRVNYNKIKITNAEVTDTIPDGLEYVNGTFEIDNNANGKFEYKDGIIKYTFNGEISDTYIITFKTKVKDKNIWANNAEKTFSNTAKLTGKGIEDSTSTGRKQVKSQVIKKTGTGYNYLTREASWKIVINQNKMPMRDVVVTDVIGEYQEFVENSIAIDGREIMIGQEYEDGLKAIFDEESKTLTIIFSNIINNTHTIEFKTKIVDESIFYTNGEKEILNIAKIKSEETPGNGIPSIGNNKIKNTVVSKKGQYESGNNFIDWEVVINQNQLPISNAILEDTLQEGLELDTSSVKLIKLVVDNDGKYEDGEEVDLDASNIKYNHETRVFEFHFTEKITEAYILKFRTDIADSHKDATFTNTINFKGSSRTVGDTSKNIKVKFQIGGGGAEGASRGSIKVIKVDENHNSQKLSGAVFELLDSYGNVLKISEPTDTDGETLFKGLKFNVTYYIREKTSPEGYAISQEVHEFMVKEENNKKDIEYIFTNTKIKGNIEFMKYDENQNKLQGAEFTLYNADDDKLERPIMSVLSNSEGKVKFENIAFGSYKIKETKPPKGYLPSDTVLEVTISEDGKTVKADPESISNTMIRGSFRLLKVRENTTTPLSDAEITIYRKDGTKVDTVITGEDGYVRLKNLAYGEYYFEETKAPSGYYRNSEKHYFSIEEDGVTVEKTLENTKIPSGGGGGGGRRKPKDPDLDPKKPEKPTEPDKPVEITEYEKPTDPEEVEIEDEIPEAGHEVESPIDPEEEVNLDDEIPRAGHEVKKPRLPKTGSGSNILYYVIGIVSLLVGIVLRKKNKSLN